MTVSCSSDSSGNVEEVEIYDPEVSKNNEIVDPDARDNDGKILTPKDSLKYISTNNNINAVFLEVYKIWPPKWVFKTTSFI